MTGALSAALASQGPLEWMAQGIQKRLQVGFPADYWDFAFMPEKADKAWYRQAARRTSLVALGWNGCVAEGEGGVFAAKAHWTVALVTKNPSIPGRYVGDNLAAGLFAMARVATLLLNGWVLRSPDKSWEATGGVIVTQIGNLYNDEWGDENTAIAALSLEVLYEETAAPGLENEPGAALQLANIWNFGEQPPLFADSTGAV